uniref:MAGUK p55 scaffold protein 3a n=1 Tax=Oryzias sinensis TaxID=183150 RepID=A0A8C7Z996_9TELE
MPVLTAGAGKADAPPTRPASRQLFTALSPAGLHETLALLTSQLRPDANHKEDMVFLKDVFSERSLGFLMKIHEKLRQYERQSPTPVLHSASCLAEDVAEELQSGPMSTDEKELLHLLTSPHLRAVLSVHDTVAQKNFDPVLPPLPDDFEDELEEESVKIVRLVKNKEPLGATIRRDEASGAVIVARIMRGGAADRSGLVHVGDELREVNGVSVIHKRPEEISQLLSQSQGSITLKIIPAIKEEDKLKESKVYMRALFDYIPLEDKATPCQEAGLPFKRGDILQIVTQDDPTWWQAKRVGDSNLRAGLIPSKQFQERQELSGMPVSFMTSRRTGLRRSFRLSRKDRQGSSADGLDSGEHNFLTYEEVTRYQQRPNERPRLVVLIGSLGARINELKQRVIAENPHRYAVAVPRKYST